MTARANVRYPFDGMLLPPIRPAIDPPPVRLPLLLDRVPAGFPSPAENYVEGRLDLNDLCVRKPAATFFVRVVGESMRDAGINAGDLLVVDRSLDPRNGSVVVAVLDGYLTVKHFHRRPGGITLRPANAAFPPIEVGEGAELDVWGVVTFGVRRYFGTRG